MDKIQLFVAMAAMWFGTLHLFEAKMNTFSLQITGQLGEIGEQLGAQATQLSQMDARVGNLDARVGNLSLQMGAQATQLSQMDARMDTLGFEIKHVASSTDALALEVKALSLSVNELLTSTLTPAAAQRTLECAQASVYVLFILRAVAPQLFEMSICSAFAYKLEDGSTLAVSAAHCFVDTTR